MTSALAAALLYLTAAALLVRAVGRDTPRPGQGWLFAAVPAIVLHGAYHVQVALQTSGGQDMHFFAALSLVGLGMAGLTSLVGARGRMAALGVVVFPLAALALVGYHLYGHEPSKVLGWRLAAHAWLALLAYATLSVAALLAIMLWLQERALRRREFRPWLRALPPLSDLESLLFRVITMGFALLTLVLVTGVLFVDDLLAQKLVHKTVLSVLSWLVFGVLLVGRRRYGWRGAKAVHWTLSAMLLLLLAFFGSQFVIELVLGHTTR